MDGVPCNSPTVVVLGSRQCVPCRPTASFRCCASSPKAARGSTQSLDGSVVGEVIGALRPHVDEEGFSLLSILTKTLSAELENNERERALLYQHKERLLENNERERALLYQQLEYERELRAQGRVDLMKARGMNDPRGLFECLQEHLARKSGVTSRLKGAPLWEEILSANAGLAACIEDCTKVPASHAVKQALNCCNVFSVLSQHAHVGKQLAELQVVRGGKIKFEKGPLSPEQVQVFLCIAAAAQVAIEEHTEWVIGLLSVVSVLLS